MPETASPPPFNQGQDNGRSDQRRGREPRQTKTVEEMRGEASDDWNPNMSPAQEGIVEAHSIELAERVIEPNDLASAIANALKNDIASVEIIATQSRISDDKARQVLHWLQAKKKVARQYSPGIGYKVLDKDHQAATSGILETADDKSVWQSQRHRIGADHKTIPEIEAAQKKRKEAEKEAAGEHQEASATPLSFKEAFDKVLDARDKYIYRPLAPGYHASHYPNHKPQAVKAVQEARVTDPEVLEAIRVSEGRAVERKSRLARLSGKLSIRTNKHQD